MKKLLILCFLLPVIGGFSYLGLRFQKNRPNIEPYPFYFKQKPTTIKLKAPVLIIGDSMAVRVSTFKDLLAKKISSTLSTPIEIDTLVSEGQNIHRSFELLKSLERLPLIIILISNRDETYESLFKTKDIEKIAKNFKIYDNIYLQSLFMIFPDISRLLYHNVSYLPLARQAPIPDENIYPDHILIQRQQINYKLYGATLNKFFNFAKKSASMVIPVTTPINLTLPPKKDCYGSIEKTAGSEIQQLSRLIKNKDFKGAYNLSQELALMYPSNASILFDHSRILTKLNKYSESHRYAELAAVYDCGNQAGDPIFNQIMKQDALKYNFVAFDYHQYLADETRRNTPFIEDIYPQDLYLEKFADILGLKIKSLLKLEL